ncbi:MAG: hypothetical protein KHW63_02610 [Alistipes sp.]|nr:hypothetical protein [Alistipes sp.]
MKRHLHSESPDPGNAHPPQHAAAVRKRVTPCGSKRYGPDTYSPQFRIYQRHSPYSKKSEPGTGTVRKQFSLIGHHFIPERIRHAVIGEFSETTNGLSERIEKRKHVIVGRRIIAVRHEEIPRPHGIKQSRSECYGIQRDHFTRKGDDASTDRRDGLEITGRRIHSDHTQIKVFTRSPPPANPIFQNAFTAIEPDDDIFTLSFRFDETTVSLVEEKRSVKIKDVVQPLHFPGGNLIDNCIRSLPTAGTTSNQQREKYR